MTPTELTAQLDGTDCDSAGVYGLTLAVPDAVDAVQRRWLETNDHPLPDAYAEQLAAASEVVYVGATGRSIRARCAEHVRGEVRKASAVRAFAVVDVAGVWPGAHTGVAERDRARTLAGDGVVCWCDGELF